MDIEYEAKFLDVDMDDVRKRLREAGSSLARAETIQRRYVFDLPGEKSTSRAYMRVRDEGGAVTMTWKMFSGAEVDHAKEIELVVSDFDTAVELLTQLGCVPTSYQENRRESWACDDVKITIDSWPFLKPFVEIEGPSEALIEAFSRTAGFDWSQAQFCSVARLYRQVHGTHVEIRQMPRLTFEMQDPFRAA